MSIDIALRPKTLGPPEVDYFHMGPWHIYVGFTTSPTAFQKEMERLNVKDPSLFVGGGGTNQAAATTHQLTKEGQLTCIITLLDNPKHDIVQVAGLLAHEAAHVAQALWSNCGETSPGQEAEAYLIQYVTQCCLRRVVDARKAKRKRKAKP